MREQQYTRRAIRLSMSCSQSPDRDAEEGRQAGQTECSVPILPLQGRQGQDRGLEARSSQNPSGLQRAFEWFCRKFVNLAPIFQTQLVLDTHKAVADTQTIAADTKVMVADAKAVVANTQTVVANTQTVVANTQTVVADTQITVTNTQSIVTDTQTMVADIHRNMLTGQKGTSDQNDSVGATSYSQIIECLPMSRLKPGQQYSLLWGP
jgi:hypothetical protein